MNIIRKPFRYCNYNTVFWLIGINVAIFIIMRFLGRNIFLLLYTLLPMRPFRITQDGWIWTFITYMFIHGSFTHVIFNMLGLFIFGTHVERQMGSKEFLLFYLITGALAGAFSFAIYYFSSVSSGITWEVLSRLPNGHPNRYGVTLVGASGALYAVQLAYAVFFPNSVLYIWGLIPLRAPIMVLVFTILTLVMMITGLQGGVAHITHLAGFIFGWLYFLVRFGINPWKHLTRRGY